MTDITVSEIDREFMHVSVQTHPDDGYTVTGRTEDGDNITVNCGALNINGKAFSTSGMSIGEYKEPVTVTKEENSRYVDIQV